MEKEKDKKFLEREKRTEEERERKKEEELNKRLQKLIEELKKIPGEKIPLQENRTYYLKEEAKILKDLDPILESERKIEENIKFIGGIEKTAITPRQRKKAEQERQLAGKERETIEKQRWDYEKKKFNVDKHLGEVNFGFEQLAQKEAKLKQNIEDVNEALKKIDKEKSRIEIQEKIRQLSVEKKDYATTKDKILEERREVEEKLAEIVNRERKVEQEVGYIESEESMTEDTEKQRVEKERSKMQKIRSEIEKERWVIEDELRKIRLEENRINVRYDRVLEGENLLRKKIEEINTFLGSLASTDIPEIEKLKENKVPDGEKITTTEEVGKNKIGATEKIGPQKAEPIDTRTDEKELSVESKKAQEALKKIEEKKEREELLKKLREKREEDVERKENQLLQRIKQGASSTPSPESPAKTATVQEAMKQTVPSMTISPDSVNKKSKIRTLIIVASVMLIVLIAGFWYWYIKVRKNPTPAPAPVPVDETPEPTPAPAPVPVDETPEPTPVTEMPPALIAIDTTIPYRINNDDQILPFVAQAFRDLSLSENEFVRIVIEDTEKNKYLNLEELLPFLHLTPSETLYSQLKNDITLYLFPAKDYNVLGFVAENSEETKDTEIEETMRSWEADLSIQTRTLGAVLGKTNMVPIAAFQKNNYKGIVLHYLTLVPGPDCYGVCYAVSNNKLFFATCCDPIINLINRTE